MALFKTIGANKFVLMFFILGDSFKFVAISNFIAFPFAYFILRMTTDVFEEFFGYKY
jgi:hypothetical protein